MKKFTRPVVMAAIGALILAGGVLSASAQQRGDRGDRGAGDQVQQGDRGGDRAGDRGPGGPRNGDKSGKQDRRFDPAQMQERVLERLKETMAATDEEWPAIKPLLGKVVELQFRSRMGGFGLLGRGRPGEGRPGEPRPGEPRPGEGPGAMVSPEMDALAKALDTESTSTAELKDKLKAYREAQAKSEKELQTAREALRAVLSLKQEAQLVLRGILD